MTVPLSPDAGGTSTRPYLIRALHDWCTDNGFTPYLAVFVDGSVQVPVEYVKNNEIVLNVGFEATSGLKLGNDFIEFRARFGGVARDIVVPVDHVVAIYARENGQGMAFPVPTDAGSGTLPGAASTSGTTSVAPAPARAAPVLRLAGSEPPQEDRRRRDREPPEKPKVTPPGDDDPSSPTPGGGRPALKRIK